MKEKKSSVNYGLLKSLKTNAKFFFFLLLLLLNYELKLT